MNKQISIVIPYYIKNKKFYLWTQTRCSDDELNGLLEFPGGKVEEGESVIVAAQREVLEETKVRLNLDDLRLFKRYEFSNNLEISVYLFNDKNELFEISGYWEIQNLIELAQRIPPNNLRILKDLNFAKSDQI